MNLNQGNDANAEGLLIDAGDADWRRDLWRATIDSLESTSDWLFGHGHGPVLGDLLPGPSGQGYGHDLRTPHNFAVYLLGYTGLIGCALYLGLIGAILLAILECPVSAAKDAALASGLSVIVMAVSGNVLETPIGAVPTYLILGMLISMGQRQFRTAPVNASMSRFKFPGGFGYSHVPMAQTQGYSSRT